MIKQALTSMAFLASAITSSAQHNVRFLISSLPQFHSTDSSIFLAGSFNGWNPQNKDYKFQKDEKGNYFRQPVWKVSDKLMEKIKGLMKSLKPSLSVVA